jgi:hypothetical protein
MNDIELVRQFRAEVPTPDPEALVAGRRRLMAVIMQTPTQQAPRLRLLRPLRRPSVVLIAAGLAAILAMATVTLSGTRRAPTQYLPAQMRLASEVLHRAAAERAARRTVRPATHQWIYTTFVDQAFGQRTERTSGWLRFDGRQDAYLDAGRVVVHDHPAPSVSSDPLRAYIENPTPMSSYAALASLPADPRALLRRVLTAARNYGYDPNGLPTLARLPLDTPSRLEFQFVAQLLWQDSQSGIVSGGANVFRALSLLPGVTAQEPIRDAMGRPAIGLSDDGGEFQILLSPGTYQVLGYRTVSTGSEPTLPNGGHVPAGTVLESVALAPRFVSGPGAH